METTVARLAAFMSGRPSWSAPRESAPGGPASEATAPAGATGRRGKPKGLSSSQIGPQGAEAEGEKCQTVTGPFAEFAVGGSFGLVKIPGMKIQTGGGCRRPITCFSWRSRQGLLRVVNSIDRTKFDPAQVLLTTLTYPAVFPTPREAKRHLKVALQRWDREWGPTAMLWKLEPQRRGAPHFHLLVMMQASFSLDAVRAWWSRVWFEVVASQDEAHFRAGTQVQRIRSWNGVTSYAAKYLGKSVEALEDVPGWDRPGRWWGQHRCELLPIKLQRQELSSRAAKLLRRSCIRWFEHQPSGVYRFCNASEDERGHLVERGPVYRRRCTADQLRQLERFFSVRPYHRKWPTARGGCTMFIPAAVFARLLAWVRAEVGEPNFAAARMDEG